MIKQLVICGFLLTMTSCWGTGERLSYDPRAITKVDLIYSDLDALTPISISCEELSSFSNIQKVAVSSPEDFVLLKFELDKIVATEKSFTLDRIDARALMIIHRIDSTEAVFCIGNGAIEIEGTIYPLSDELNKWLHQQTE